MKRTIRFTDLEKVTCIIEESRDNFSFQLTGEKVHPRQTYSSDKTVRKGTKGHTAKVRK